MRPSVLCHSNKEEVNYFTNEEDVHFSQLHAIENDSYGYSSFSTFNICSNVENRNFYDSLGSQFQSNANCDIVKEGTECNIRQHEVANLTVSSNTAENNIAFENNADIYQLICSAPSHISDISFISHDTDNASIPGPCSIHPVSSELDEMFWNHIACSNGNHYINNNGEFQQTTDGQTLVNFNSPSDVAPLNQHEYEQLNDLSGFYSPVDESKQSKVKIVIKPSKILIETLIKVMPFIIQQYPRQSKNELCHHLKGQLYQNSPKPSAHFLYNTLIPVFVTAAVLKFQFKNPFFMSQSLTFLKSWIFEQPGGKMLLNKIKLQAYIAAPVDDLLSYQNKNNEYFDYCLNCSEYSDQL